MHACLYSQFPLGFNDINFVMHIFSACATAMKGEGEMGTAMQIQWNPS